MGSCRTPYPSGSCWPVRGFRHYDSPAKNRLIDRTAPPGALFTCRLRCRHRNILQCSPVGASRCSAVIWKDDRVDVRRCSAELVFPAFLPGQVSVGQVLKRHTAQPVLKSDNCPGSQPVVTPRSLSTVTEWVSKTTLTAIGDHPAQGASWPVILRTAARASWPTTAARHGPLKMMKSSDLCTPGLPAAALAASRTATSCATVICSGGSSG
jgi:hypothetical protein